MPVKVISRGSRFSRMSIQLCTTSTDPKIKNAGSTAIESSIVSSSTKRSANATQIATFNSSITIGSMPIGLRHRRHLPPSANQLNTGTRSRGPRRKPQFPHALGGRLMLPPRGTRSATTVKNEPINRPNTTTNGIKNRRLIRSNQPASAGS